MKVIGLESPISKKKKNYLSHFKEHRKGECMSCTEMFTQVKWIIKLFVCVLLALGDPLNTELSLEAGGDAGYRGRPVTTSEKPKLAWLNNPLLLSFPIALQLLQGTTVTSSRSVRPCELHGLVIQAASQVIFLPLLPLPASLRFLSRRPL